MASSRSSTSPPPPPSCIASQAHSFLAHHGCDRAVGEDLISGRTAFKASENDWDWLGKGVYFWEANPRRAIEFAGILQRWRKGKAGLPPINEPFVVGAAIDLGFCLDLTTSTGIEAVAGIHADFVAVSETANRPIPENEGGADLLFRKLDCAVINHLHTICERSAPPLDPFDTVKGGPYLSRVRVQRQNPHPNRRAEFRVHQGRFSGAGGTVGNLNKQIK